MREIDLNASDNPNVMPVQTFLGYGDTRAGKTTFFAGMPRPVIFADGTEKGWESIANLAEENLFEPGVIPLVWAIETQADIPLMVEKARPLIASGRIKSIVFDSATFYADLALNGIIQAQGAKYDVRSAYGSLGNHLRHVRLLVHGLGVSTAWTALARHPDEDHPTGGPMIPGAQGEKFAAGVDFLMYFRREVPLNAIAAAKTGTKYEIYTKDYQRYVAGARLGQYAKGFPSPFSGNFTQLMEVLGHDIDALRASLKPLNSIKASAPPVVAKPPVIAKPITPAPKPLVTKPLAPLPSRPLPPRS